MKSAALTGVCLLLLLGLASARIPRNDAERQHEEDRRRKQQESGVHTYYILLKPTAGANARRDLDNNNAHVDKLAEDFHKRLGDDSKVTVVAASKVSLLFCIPQMHRFLAFFSSSNLPQPHSLILCCAVA